MHGGDPGLVHIMVEVDTLDAVGQALDRVNEEGFQLSSTLGRHTNDKMVSFYVRAPGDWDIEFGTDGMRVDEKYYTAEEITADSYWGHQWVGEPPAAMRSMTCDTDVTPYRPHQIERGIYEADVVIAGYGIAGAAAAVEAARSGRRRPRPRTHRRRGVARPRWRADSSTSAAAPRCKRPAASTIPSTTWRRSSTSAMGPGADENRIADYCAGSVDHFDWLVGCGVPFKAEFFGEPGLGADRVIRA